MSNLMLVPIADLYPSRSNVRPYDPATDTALPTLVASLLSVGLIQPLAVTKRKKGKGYEVVAGQRRLAALKEARKQAPDRFAEIESIEITDATIATEASLAENYVRSAMTLPEIYSAFARIRAERPKATLEELGAMFGFDAARAGRIMRLAGLSHRVMEAYRAGSIDDAVAMAFASTADHALQDSVLDAIAELSQYQRNAPTVRRLISGMEPDIKNMMLIVGREAYDAAGGGFEDDLFTDGEGRLLDPEILRQLFDVRIDELKADFVRRLKRGDLTAADGATLDELRFSWALEPPQITQYGHTGTDWDLRVTIKTKLSDVDQQQLDALADKISALQDVLDAEQAVETDPRWAEVDQLENESIKIEGRAVIDLPKKGAIVGVINVNNGGFDVTLFHASREAAGKASPTGSSTKGASNAEPTPGEKMRKRLGLSKDGAQALNLVRRDMIRNNLIHAGRAGSDIPLDFLIYSQARSIVREHLKDHYGNATFNGDAQGVALPASQDNSSSAPPSKVRQVFAKLTTGRAYHAARAEIAQQDWVTVADPVDGWMAFRSASQTVKDLATAVVCGWGLNASTTYYGDGETPRMMVELANYLDGNEGCATWRETVVYDEAFFALISHKIRRQLLEEWGAADHPDGQKGATSAAFCARVINADAEGAAALGISDEDHRNNEVWMHENLDTNMVSTFGE